jgi:hypothetical protein
MLRWKRFQRLQHVLAVGTILLAVAMAVVPTQTAFAIITGGKGNSPITDPGWPKGAAAIFNNPVRIAWWEGPPEGGGQWHAECRGDAKAFNAVLADFAKVDVKTKRVIVHDGVKNSRWLNPNRDPAKQAAAKVDWVFMVWQGASWDRLRKSPADHNPTNARDAGKGPPSQIDVYTGGNLRWADVTVPHGLEVIDERLEAHGFTPADGIVLEGNVIDLATQRPIAARMRFERIEPQPKGGYRYTVAAEAAADTQGRWVLKKAPAGWHRVVVEADGYGPRVVGYVRFDDQPGWHAFHCGLSRLASVSGRIADDAGKPLADVEVRLADVVSGRDGRYESAQEYSSKTDADGRFRFDQVPVGKATIRLHKSGYCRPGLGHPITTPAQDVGLEMIRSARVRVAVDFTRTKRPAAYIVHMEPEEGEAVGKWSGSGNVHANNQISFDDVPPGRYVVRGQPNPSSRNQQTEPLTIDLKGGQTTQVTLSAK